MCASPGRLPALLVAVLFATTLADAPRATNTPHTTQRSDPCGKNSGADDSWGYLNGGGGWEHIACRTYDMTPVEFPDWHDGMNITRMGVVTTIHLCDLGIEGPLETMKAAFCPLRHLREFDVDGSHFTGPIPRWLATCFPHLKELDLSYGRLSGSIPDWVSELGGGNLEQFKAEHNALTGAIPSAFGAMPALRILWLHHNDMSGPLPQALANSHSLLSLDVRFNARLCGNMPSGMRTDWDWCAGLLSGAAHLCDATQARVLIHACLLAPFCA